MRKNYANLGKEQERAIVRWAKLNGFPYADRIIRTGAGKDYGHRADEGDIWLCPGVIIQSKRLDPPNRAERAVPAWMAETEAQRVAAGADLALLIVRRPGTSDVGEWWAFLRLDIAAGQPGRSFGGAVCPVRMTVGQAIRLLRAYDYGDPLGDEGAA